MFQRRDVVDSRRGGSDFLTMSWPVRWQSNRRWPGGLLGLYLVFGATVPTASASSEVELVYRLDDLPEFVALTEAFSAALIVDSGVKILHRGVDGDPLMECRRDAPIDRFCLDLQPLDSGGRVLLTLHAHPRWSADGEVISRGERFEGLAAPVTGRAARWGTMLLQEWQDTRNRRRVTHTSTLRVGDETILATAGERVGRVSIDGGPFRPLPHREAADGRAHRLVAEVAGCAPDVFTFEFKPQRVVFHCTPRAVRRVVVNSQIEGTRVWQRMQGTGWDYVGVTGPDVPLAVPLESDRRTPLVLKCERPGYLGWTAEVATDVVAPRFDCLLGPLSRMMIVWSKVADVRLFANGRRLSLRAVGPDDLLRPAMTRTQTMKAGTRYVTEPLPLGELLVRAEAPGHTPSERPIRVGVALLPSGEWSLDPIGRHRPPGDQIPPVPLYWVIGLDVGVQGRQTFEGHGEVMSVQRASMHRWIARDWQLGLSGQLQQSLGEVDAGWGAAVNARFWPVERWGASLEPFYRHDWHEGGIVERGDAHACRTYGAEAAIVWQPRSWLHISLGAEFAAGEVREKRLVGATPAASEPYLWSTFHGSYAVGVRVGVDWRPGHAAGRLPPSRQALDTEARR